LHPALGDRDREDGRRGIETQIRRRVCTPVESISKVSLVLSPPLSRLDRRPSNPGESCRTRDRVDPGGLLDGAPRGYIQRYREDDKPLARLMGDRAHLSLATLP
jgi:hypothetical protein